LQNSFDALSSFDQINLGSTLLQAVVAVSFAAVQQGFRKHFDRPAMRAMSTLWHLMAVAAVVQIFSSWSGAVWNSRELSRMFNSVVIAFLAAGIPYVQSATDALGYSEPRERPVVRLAIAWGVCVGVVHAIGVFGLGAAMPDVRVVAVSYSRSLKLVVLSVPAVSAWTPFARAHQHQRALRLLAIGCSALAVRQVIGVTLGLRVGMPDLPFAAVVGAIIVEILAVMLFGVMSLLANTAEEVSVVQRKSEVLVQAEARLASGERMESLGRLAAGVAHDFNNVLQVIRLSAASVRPALTDPQDRGALDDVDSATTHGAALVSQLLTFARQQPQDPKRFDALDRIRSLTPLLQRVAGSESNCRIDIASGMAVIVMDPAQFEQIAINLVSNARDAIEPGGRISVELDVVSLADAEAARTGVTSGDYARLVVEDNGHGIPAEIRSRIFEPFFTTKQNSQGSGLGLAMVHGIVRRAGGIITLETTPGQGTRFEVYVPAVEVVRLGKGKAARENRSKTPPVELSTVRS
jgi:signal transduction histidine kinase